MKEEHIVHNSPCDFPKESADIGVAWEGMCQTLPCPMHCTPNFTTRITILLECVIYDKKTELHKG